MGTSHLKAKHRAEVVSTFYIGQLSFYVITNASCTKLLLSPLVSDTEETVNRYQKKKTLNEKACTLSVVLKALIDLPSYYK